MDAGVGDIESAGDASAKEAAEEATGRHEDGGDVVVAEEEERLQRQDQQKQQQQQPKPKDLHHHHSPASTPRISVAEPPKWRFVNVAKKSEGYSSTAAGSYIEGISAEKLGAKYVAPKDDDGNRRSSGNGGRAIGKVTVPSFMLEGEESYEVRKAPRVSLSPGASGGVDHRALESGEDDTKKVEDPDLLRLEAERERLRTEILEAEEKKRELQEVTAAAREETERLHEEREQLLRERAEADAAAEAGAATTATTTGVAAAAPVELEVVEEDLGGGGGGDKSVGEDNSNNGRNKCRMWAMCALIVVLLGAVGALLGIMLGGGGSKNDPSELKDGDDNSGGTKTTITNAPTLSPLGGPPTSSETRLPTAPPSRIVAEVVEVVDDAEEEDEFFTCPENTKRFDLAVLLGADPSAVTWNVLDRCTLEAYYTCSRCYARSKPDRPVSFGGCLPSTLTDDGRGEGKEFVLQIIDGAGSGSVKGFLLRYDGEVAFEVNNEVAGDEDGQEVQAVNGVQNNHFGEGNGCSKEPSEAPSSPPQPYIWGPRPAATPRPTASLTVNIALEATPGCTPYTGMNLNGPSFCDLQASREHKIVPPLDAVIERDGRMFGSSATFVGTSGKIVAVGSSIVDSNGGYVHLYIKPEDPYLDDFYLWEYLTSLNLVDWETADVLFGASLASNQDGYIAVGAPLKTIPDDSDDASGKVYLFRPNDDFTSWDMVTRFSASDGTFAPSFGASVAMDENLVAVGSPDEDEGRGRVYIYENSGNLWVEAAKLSPMDDLSTNAQFGASVSLHGATPATLAVGAPGNGAGGTAGDAFVYKRQDFEWVAQMLNSRDIEEGDGFGSEVVISGCSVAVTAPGDITSSSSTGTIRIFELDAESDSWVQSQIVEPTDRPEGAVFGRCIAMEGDTLVVGTPWSLGEGDERSGLVHHYERVNGMWVEVSSTQNTEYRAGIEDSFGCPIALSGDKFIVGARGDNSVGTLSGSAFIYDLCPMEEEV